MKRVAIFRILIVFLCGITAIGCTEQYILQTNTFEDALVVEATITNEFQTQKIKISRTYRFEDNAPTNEIGAAVYVTDDLGTQFDFEENNGMYTSTSPFKAEPGRTYRLNITTAQGRTYNSTSEVLSPINEMQNVTASVKTKNGLRGVAITANSFDPSRSSQFYRYEYEETYKIKTPKWDAFKAILADDNPNDTIVLVPRDNTEIRTCYSTDNSNDIIQTTTVDLSEDRVNFDLRFISDQNAIISHRYSILVKQYVQNREAYTFYKAMKDLSGSGSILSQNQPGFFYGNIKSQDNPDEKVLGFFEVASVSSQRIFFNYEDLFPGEDLPPYFVDCDSKIYKFCFVSADPECRGNQLLSIVGAQSLLYFDLQGLYYYMVSPQCGDCTTFASNVIPPFWTE